MKNPIDSDCSRRQILRLLPTGIGAGVVLQLFGGCGGGNGAPSEGVIALTGRMGLLSFATFPHLEQVGGSAVVDTDQGDTLVVVRTAPDAAAALTAICTHQGCVLHAAASGTTLSCGCHGSEFDLGGNVLRGPARSPLAVYRASVQADGIAVDLA